MRVVIIGAGLAGSVASGAFAALNPTNYDKRAPTDEARHKAVMRLRDANVAKYLGIDVEPVTVWKAVAWENRLYETADMRMNNQYSYKLYRELGERSLRSLGRVKRWLVEGSPLPRKTHWNHKLVGVLDGQLMFETREHDSPVVREVVDYDVCISTMPMPMLLKAASIRFTERFECRPIWVWHGTLHIPSTLHQTIYFPGMDTPAYRVTIQGRKVIIESISDGKIDVDRLMWHFGLGSDDFDVQPKWDPENQVKFEMFRQSMGKMVAIDDNARRQYIYELTDRFRIYSLGRFAIWKPVRADHLVQDIDKIKRLVKLGGASAGYEHNRARIS